MRTLLLVLIAAIVAGCGSSDRATTTTPTVGYETSYRSHGPRVEDVAGKTFVSTSVRGDHRLVPGTRITLSFGPETLTASAGCATIRGRYSLYGDGLQLTGDIEQTTVGCEPELAAQDEWLTGFLTTQSSSQLVGKTLSLGGRGVYMTLDEE